MHKVLQSSICPNLTIAMVALDCNYCLQDGRHVRIRHKCKLLSSAGKRCFLTMRSAKTSANKDIDTREIIEHDEAHVVYIDID
mmetsp:Transcript_24672/g.79782  ORF Transcript_24672/g.79782 Transcript_24672/m.79782 type:complete len:83 (+) Transcript_24672:1315-1563(+)